MDISLCCRKRLCPNTVAGCPLARHDYTPAAASAIGEAEWYLKRYNVGALATALSP
jgi:hypothetical protein